LIEGGGCLQCGEWGGAGQMLSMAAMMYLAVVAAGPAHFARLLLLRGRE